VAAPEAECLLLAGAGPPRLATRRGTALGCATAVTPSRPVTYEAVQELGDRALTGAVGGGGVVGAGDHQGHLVDSGQRVTELTAALRRHWDVSP
jgi:hypothetical protein